LFDGPAKRRTARDGAISGAVVSVRFSGVLVLLLAHVGESFLGCVLHRSLDAVERAFAVFIAVEGRGVVEPRLDDPRRVDDVVFDELRRVERLVAPRRLSRRLRP
jgi:hypothetical protein